MSEKLIFVSVSISVRVSVNFPVQSLLSPPWNWFHLLFSEGVALTSLYLLTPSNGALLRAASLHKSGIALYLSSIGVRSELWLYLITQTRSTFFSEQGMKTRFIAHSDH